MVDGRPRRDSLARLAFRSFSISEINRNAMPPTKQHAVYERRASASRPRDLVTALGNFLVAGWASANHRTGAGRSTWTNDCARTAITPDKPTAAVRQCWLPNRSLHMSRVRSFDFLPVSGPAESHPWQTVCGVIHKLCIHNVRSWTVLSLAIIDDFTGTWRLA